MKIYLIRHGQTAWNREQVFRGGADIELDEIGRTQAGLLAERLRGDTIDSIRSGPLKRALQTAQPIAEAVGQRITIEPGLDDMRFGRWEGMAHTEVAEKYPEEYRRWKSQPWLAHIPEGSSLEEVGERAWGSLQLAIGKAEAADTLALVTHRVVLKLLVLRMMGLGLEGFWRVKLSPCSLSVFEWDGEKFVMECFNDTCHLKGMQGKAVDF